MWHAWKPLWRLRQGDHRFKANLGYMMTLCYSFSCHCDRLCQKNLEEETVIQLRISENFSLSHLADQEVEKAGRSRSVANFQRHPTPTPTPGTFLYQQGPTTQQFYNPSNNITGDRVFRHWRLWEMFHMQTAESPVSSSSDDTEFWRVQTTLKRRLPVGS